VEGLVFEELRMHDGVMPQVGIFIRLNTDFNTALARTTAALKAEGFGVLTEIDVKDTLRTNLGVDHTPYTISGACNPPLPYRALSAAPEVGLLLPCNVTVRQIGEDLVEVGLVDPMAMLGVVGHPDLVPVAEQARDRLRRVRQTLSSE
jgi:uncharacterized protein (DUF302 family)